MKILPGKQKKTVLCPVGEKLDSIFPFSVFLPFCHNCLIDIFFPLGVADYSGMAICAITVTYVWHNSVCHDSVRVDSRQILLFPFLYVFCSIVFHLLGYGDCCIHS